MSRWQPRHVLASLVKTCNNNKFDIFKMSDFNYKEELRPDQLKFLKEWRLEHLYRRTLPICAAGFAVGYMLMKGKRLQKHPLLWFKPGFYAVVFGVGANFQLIAGETFVRNKFLDKYPEIWMKKREELDEAVRDYDVFNKQEQKQTRFPVEGAAPSDALVSVSGKAKTYEQYRTKNHEDFWRTQKLEPLKPRLSNMPGFGQEINEDTNFGDEGFSKG